MEEKTRNKARLDLRKEKGENSYEGRGGIGRHLQYARPFFRKIHQGLTEHRHDSRERDRTSTGKRHAHGTVSVMKIWEKLQNYWEGRTSLGTVCSGKKGKKEAQ